METMKDSSMYHLFSIEELMEMNLLAGLQQALENAAADSVKEVIIRYSDIAHSGIFLVQSTEQHSLTFSYQVPDEEVDFVMALIAKRDVRPLFYLEGSSNWGCSHEQQIAVLNHAGSMKVITIPKKRTSINLLNRLQEYPVGPVYFTWEAIYAHPESARMYAVSYFSGELSQPWHEWPKNDRYGLIYADFSEGPRNDAFWIADSHRNMDQVSAGFPLTRSHGMDNIQRLLRLWNHQGPEFMYRHILGLLPNGGSYGFDMEYAQQAVRSFSAYDQDFLKLTHYNSLISRDDKGVFYLSTHHGYAHSINAGWWKAAMEPWVRLLSLYDFIFRTAEDDGSYVPLLVLIASGVMSEADAVRYVALTTGEIAIVGSKPAGYSRAPRYQFLGKTLPFKFFGRTWKAWGTQHYEDVVAGIEIEEVL
jgi:hypothetical protein